MATMATRSTPAGPISESITPMPAISIGNDDDDWEIEYRMELQERQTERLAELTKQAEEDFNKRKANAQDDRAILERVHESFMRSLLRIKQMLKDEEDALLEREREVRKWSKGEVEDELSEQLTREQQELWDQLRGRRYLDETASEQKTRRLEQHPSSTETQRATAQQRQPSQAPLPQPQPISRPTMWVPPETPKEVNRIPVPRLNQRWVSGSSTAPSPVQPSRTFTCPPMQYGPSSSSSVTSLPLRGNPSLGQNAPPPSSDVSVFGLPERGFSSSAHKISNYHYVKKSALPPMPSKQAASHRVEDSLQTSPQTRPGRRDRVRTPSQSRISPKPRGENSSEPQPPTDKRHPSSSLSGSYPPSSTQRLFSSMPGTGSRGADTSSYRQNQIDEPKMAMTVSNRNHRPSVGNAKTASTMGSSHHSSIKQRVSSLSLQSKATSSGFEQTLEDRALEREASRTDWNHKREEALKQKDEIRKKGFFSSASSAAMSILSERDSPAAELPNSKRGFGLSTNIASKPSVDYEESGEQLESRDESLHRADGTPRTDNLNASGHFKASPPTDVSFMQRQKGGA